LKAVHSRLKTFEIEDIGSGNRYQGKIDNAAMESATHATINKNYQATLRESSEGTPSTGVSKKYSLLSLESPAEDHAQ